MADTNQEPKSAAELIVFIGTAFLAQARFLRHFPRAVVWAIDVPAELRQLHSRPSPDHQLHKIPIGVNQTVHSVVESHGTLEQLQALLNRPVTASAKGHSQLRGVGQAAARQLIGRRDFCELLEHDLIPTPWPAAAENSPKLSSRSFTAEAEGPAPKGRR